MPNDSWDDWKRDEREPGPSNAKSLQFIPLPAQSILAERRALCTELTRERDPIARGLIEFQIADCDRLLDALNRTPSAIEVLRSSGLLLLLLLSLIACGDNTEPFAPDALAPDTASPDAGCNPADVPSVPGAPCGAVTCDDLRARTEPTEFAEAAIPGVVEILDDQDFYVCPYDMPPISDVTWTTMPRRDKANGELGAIVVHPGYRCEWRFAIEIRDLPFRQCGAP